MDRDQLAALVAEHQAAVYRYLRYLGVRSPATAEDLVQETFLAAFRNPDGPGESADDALQAAWLRGIARNLFLAHCRRERSGPTYVSADSLRLAERVWATDFLADGDGYDAVEALRLCLDRLPADKRELVNRRYVEDWSRERLAAAYRISEDGVKAALRRVRADLFACITRRLGADRR